MSTEPPTAPLFREEALRHHAAGQAAEGEILRVSPVWAERCYRLLVAAIAAAALYAVLGTVGEYTSGPAVVRMAGRTELHAPSAGIVRSVEVQPGQPVEAGAVLVRLNDAEPRAELARAEQEFELQLVRMMRDPSDEAARTALTALRAQRDLAAARLEELAIRAPRAGVVADVRVGDGARVAPGDPLLSLTARGEGCSLVVILPGHAAPQIGPGTPLRFEVAGHPYVYQDLAVESIGAQVLGPAEVRRSLGPDVADALVIEGPALLVEARPASCTFTSGGVALPYVDGMIGRAEARLDAESILFTLVPGLKALREL
ncbi:efflux RND transporter periplasmic adaptor subunit [Sorangium sp. So ce131]|uniref:efflux RND transporter periplasmic adaptor subunit n=1 Tax=Sorangium sp. So ce131 TaxID=3133282 RepID=UPI003F5E0CF9